MKIENQKNRLYLIILSFYALVAFLAPLLANDKPLYFHINGQTFFPALNNKHYIDLPDNQGKTTSVLINSIDWKKYTKDIFFPLVTWSPVNADLENILSSPFDTQYFITDGNIEKLPNKFRHYLGTGSSGNDLLSGLIHGSRTSIAIGVFSTLLALIPGLLLGAAAGFFGDDKLKVRRGGLLISLLLVIPGWFYSFHLRINDIKEAFLFSLPAGLFQVLIGICILSFLLLWPFFITFRNSFLNKKLSIPVDSLISRTIEIFLSLPRLILILTLAALSRPSLIGIICIIGFTSWTEIARIVRGQFLLLRESNFVHAASAIGLSNTQIIVKHMLPNVISQLKVIIVFSIASSILLETGLSFLGAGVSADTATWGSLLFQARVHFQSWWLVVFPGLALFGLLFSLYKLADVLKRTSQPNGQFLNKI